MLCITNGNRAGVLKHMRISQYEAALKEQERSGGDQLIVSVVKHKTAEIYGAAHLNINKQIAPLMAGYVEVPGAEMPFCY